jgi:uncharacterized protein (TIGR03435 family)
MFPSDWTPFLPGGKYRHPAVSLESLIAVAYSIPHADRQIVGLPSWTQDSPYTIEAVAGEDFAQVPLERQHAQVLLMLQALLADRFHLQFHTEERPTETYELRLAPGGLKNMTPGTPVARAGVYPGVLNATIADSGGRMIGKPLRPFRMASVTFCGEKADPTAAP